MSRVHTWKASSPVKARLTSNSIFITFLEDAQLKTFSERIPSSASLAYPAQKLLKNVSSRKSLSTAFSLAKNLSLKMLAKKSSPLRKVTLEKSPRKPLSLFLSQAILCSLFPENALFSQLASPESPFSHLP